MSSENPYSPPEARVEDMVPAGASGGTLADGIAGRYDFSMEDVFKEAWRRTEGMKGAFWAAAIVIIIAMTAVGVLLEFVLGSPPDDPEAVMTAGQLASGFAKQLISSGVSYPLMAGLLMIGVRRSVDLPVSTHTAFSYFNHAVPLFVVGLLTALLTYVGFLLLLLPGVYLMVAYILVVPLVTDKGLGPWHAMEASRRAITRRWFKVFLVLLVTSLILLVSAIPLLIGLIWSYPWAINVIGVLYREIFGVEAAREGHGSAGATIAG
ncbi:MAG: hypothetical protein U9R74_04940 [Pseudomonadota bacterium]|nr:hypothetical protein [Pseudomonadota bacterium]